MVRLRLGFLFTIVALSTAESRGQINPNDLLKDAFTRDYVVKDADQSRMADDQQKRLALLKQQATTNPAATQPVVNPSASPEAKLWRWRAKPNAPQAVKEWVASFDEMRSSGLNELQARMNIHSMPGQKEGQKIDEDWKKLKEERDRIADTSQVPIFTEAGMKQGRVMLLGDVQVLEVVDKRTFIARRSFYRVRVVGIDTAALRPNTVKKIDVPLRVSKALAGLDHGFKDETVLEVFEYAPYVEKYPAPPMVIKKAKAALPAPPGSVHVLLASIPTDPKSEVPLAMTESQQKQFPQWAQRNLVGKPLETNIRSDEIEPAGKEFAVRGFGNAVFANGVAIWFEVQAQLDQSQKSMVPQRTTGPVAEERVLSGRVKQVILVPQTPALGMKPEIPARIVFVLSGCKLKEYSGTRIDLR